MRLPVSDAVFSITANEKALLSVAALKSTKDEYSTKNKGNTFIGIEKEPKYYDLAVARVFR